MTNRNKMAGFAAFLSVLGLAIFFFWPQTHSYSVSGDLSPQDIREIKQLIPVGRGVPWRYSECIHGIDEEPDKSVRVYTGLPHTKSGRFFTLERGPSGWELVNSFGEWLQDHQDRRTSRGYQA